MSNIMKSEAELMKLCYDTCVDCNWNNEKVFRKLDLYANDIKKYTYKYMTEVKKESISEESFCFLLVHQLRKLLKVTNQLLN